LESFQHEHRAVAAAIELQDARAANGQQRYRRLAKEAKALTGPPLTR
jgi:hypothetical protein